MHVAWCFAEMGSRVRVVEVYLDVIVLGEDGFNLEVIKSLVFRGLQWLIICRSLVRKQNHVFSK